MQRKIESQMTFLSILMGFTFAVKWTLWFKTEVQSALLEINSIFIAIALSMLNRAWYTWLFSGKWHNMDYDETIFKAIAKKRS